MQFETLCVHGHKGQHDQTGAISTPIYQTATFAHPAVGISTGYDYSRTQNPTRENLEKTIAQLENGHAALAFSSGMAAISGMMELFSPGDHIIASDDLYGGTYRLFQHISQKNGLEIDLINTSIIGMVESAIQDNTKALFIETPTNPLMHVTDISAIAQIAHKKAIKVIVDNTFLTPYFQKPLDEGADLVIHSGTKYLAGHNDTLAGFIVTSQREDTERLKTISKTIGSCLSPFDSWLVLRGLKTLSVRLEKQQASAIKIVAFLQANKHVKQLYYPGLKDSCGYAVSQRQSAGFGSMVTFSLDSEMTARRILNKIRIIQYAESLGGVESLMTYPIMQTHADMPPELLNDKGISKTLLRLSVGLENANDLIADLTQAMEERNDDESF